VLTGLTGVTGNGTGTVTFTGTVAQVNTAMNGLSYLNTADYNSTGVGTSGNDTLTVTVRDDGKDSGVLASNGPQNAATRTVDITITAVQDITNDTVTTNEDTDAVFNAITGTSGATADSFENTGRIVTAVTQGTNGTVMFLANGQITYKPNANFVGSDSFTYSVTSGGITETATVNVTVGSVNDAPAGTDKTVSINEEQVYTFAAGDFGFTDPNDTPANALQSVVITTLPLAAEGVLKLNGVAVTPGQVIALAQIGQLTFTPAANVNGSGIGDFTFQVRDDGGTLNGGLNTDASPNTFQFTVAPLNDAPATGVPGTQTLLEDATLTFSGANAITFSDIDAGTTGEQTVTLSVTNGKLTLGTTAGLAGLTGNGTGTVTFTGTLAEITAAVAGLVYAPSANFNGSDMLTITQIDDGLDKGNTTANGALSAPVASVPITITSVNDAPAGTDKTVSIDEDQVYTFAASDFGFTDPNDTPANALLSVVITTLPVAAEGVLKLNGVAVTTGQVITAAQIGQLTFTPATNVNGSGVGDFTFQVRDDGGTANGGQNTDASANTFQFTLAAVNDAPSTAASGAQTVLEDGTLTFAGATGITFSDVDAGTVGEQTVTLTVTNGKLTLGTTAGLAGLTGNGTSTVSFAGTLAEINAAVAGLIYAPNANFNGADTLVITQTDDGLDQGNATTNGVLSATVRNVPITITSVNDAPAGADNTVSIDEDQVYTFAAADFGFSDPNDTPANAFQSVIIKTLPAASEGVLKLSGVAVTAGQVITSAQIGLLTFTPALHSNGSGLGDFTFQVKDNGGTANGGADTDASPNTFQFNIAPINDAPVTTAPATQTVLEDNSLTFSVANANAITFSDLDAGTMGEQTVTLTVGNGTLTLGSS
jgi:Bacterial Ig domain